MAGEGDPATTRWFLGPGHADHLDAANDHTVRPEQLLRLLTRRLFGYRAAPPPEESPFAPVPDLARSAPTIDNGGLSPDGLTCRLTIRRGVYWDSQRPREVTAHDLVRSTFPQGPDHTGLIHAGAGGVGQLLIQLAQHTGARVLTTVSTAEKAELAKQAGADEVIRYTEVDFAEEGDRLTDDGVDVVYDSVGVDTFDRSLSCLRPRGYLVLFGQSSGAVEPLDPQRLAAGGSLFLTRPTLFDHIATPDELRQRAVELFDALADDSLRVRIDRRLPLAEAAEAHRYIEGRGTRGKVLLLP